MRTASKFPRKAKVLDGVRIKLSDGIVLAAKIWLPEDAEEQPVPAILEYLPYRYQDRTAPRDALTHPYFAGHGYACVRVDMRGAGNSEGVLLGEYLKQEQDDALEILDWIANQPWSTGRAGIIGISWGGFNGLQIAARKPDSLKAVVSICSTDDRYTDDIHYMGGAMLCDNIAWSTYMFSLNTTPPDPELLGSSWKEVWKRRLEGSGLWLEQWLEHQHRDEFYKHGSVCESYADIECPVYAVGGWADGYSNAVFRLLANLKAPCKGLIGPWAHKYPHFAKPGPAIGFLRECLRWWDLWLKGIDNGIMDEPALRVWMQYPAPPKTQYDYRPGKWVAEKHWPAPRIKEQTFHLVTGGLADRPDGLNSALKISSPQTIGRASGVWCPHGLTPDLADDQRIEAGGSLNFATEALRHDLEILGAPTATLDLACDKPEGQVAVCLNEILPNGAATRVSFGVLNLSHRNGHENPEPLVPGEFEKVSIRLNEIAHRFAAGHRIQISVSTAYWPMIWPSPEKTTATIRLAESLLRLPVREPNPADAGIPSFCEPESAEPLRHAVHREPRSDWTVATDMNTGEVQASLRRDEGCIEFEEYDGWTMDTVQDESYSIRPDDPCSAQCDITWKTKYSRRGWNVASRTRTQVTSNATHFNLEAELEAWHGGETVQRQKWKKSFKRKNL